MSLEEKWLVEFVNLRPDAKYDDIITWLIGNIEDVSERQTKGDFIGRPKPYHFSSISQFARFSGISEKWYLEIQGNEQRKTVRFSDQVPTRKIVEFVLRYTYA
jgi:hypothetical protein